MPQFILTTKIKKLKKNPVNYERRLSFEVHHLSSKDCLSQNIFLYVFTTGTLLLCCIDFILLKVKKYLSHWKHSIIVKSRLFKFELTLRKLKREVYWLLKWGM